MLDQIEGGCIQPLEIVEEQRQWMLGPCKYADKSPEHQLEATLCFLWRKNGKWRLLSDNQLQFRDQIHHAVSYTHLTLPTIYSV